MRYRAPIIAGIVGVAALALVVIFAVSPKGEDARKVTSPVLGQLAPEITGKTIDGDKFNLDRLRGEWVLVNFMASWCPPCVEEHPELTKLSKDDGGPLQVVSVVSQDTNANVRDFFDEHGGSWPVVGGDTGPISINYGLKKVPESFLIDPSGMVVIKYEGRVSYKNVVGQIEELTSSAQTTDSEDGGS